ncbi:MAG: hypothetical protein GC180_07010 [Bacteroidetes bacterium]|nr:hypothetical protein [Bacteroidota bacterium]
MQRAFAGGGAASSDSDLGRVMLFLLVAVVVIGIIMAFPDWLRRMDESMEEEIEQNQSESS